LREESEQLERAHFPRRKRVQIPRRFSVYSVVPFFVVVSYCTNPYNIKKGTVFEAAVWHETEAFFGFFLLLLGLTVQVIQYLVGHIFRGTNLEEVVQLYGLGHVFQDKIFGTVC
jgi:hypothetical protein